MTKPAKAAAGEAVPDDERSVEAVVARFGGNTRAALESALDDIAHLERELVVASLAMSFGFARGWRPSIDRRDP
jgi:hypothetical protein